MNLLIVEDAPNYVDFLRMELAHSAGQFNIHAVDSLLNAERALDAGPFDAIVLDLHLPDSSGLNTLLKIREKTPHLPVVVLTGCQDEHIAVKAVESGAQDYLLKDRLLHGMLARALCYAVQRRQAEQKLLESQEQLRQSQKMEAVGRLAGGVAHDFNNLLTVILGYCSMLLVDLPKESALRENVIEIKKTSERAAGLTQQLLTFSRKRPMQAASVDLNRAIADLEKMIGRVMPENVEVTMDLSPELPPINVDPGQLAQVILNLAVNARDAMPRGGRLSITTRLERAKTDRVALIVHDTGCGMSRETLSHLFEPFYTTKEEGKGTGLGLSVVYGIVHQSGGQIEVDSREGIGTQFRLYFPAVREIEKNRPAAEPASGRPMGKETILLVEDEEAVRRLAARMLREHGYQVLEAKNGQDAVALAQQKKSPIHLVITDLVMPKMGGFLAAQLLSHLEPRVKTLFMTGHAQDDVALVRIMESGYPLLTKPFTVEALVGKVREVLDSPSPAEIVVFHAK